MAECRAPGGKIRIAVPAHQWMWSAHDVVNHHHRRYSKASLAKAIADAGLTHNGLRWFNSLLFPAAAAARSWGNPTGKDASDDSPPPTPLNPLFATFFRTEPHLLGHGPFNLGLSLFPPSGKPPLASVVHVNDGFPLTRGIAYCRE